MIYGRPELTKDMGSKLFLEYYYLENEMTDFCKKNGLDATGGRNTLKDRIAHFLNGGKESDSRFVIKPELDMSVISDDLPIEPDFVFSAEHGRYFVGAVGPEFIPYEDFIIWLEENQGRTYGEAVEFWYLLHAEVDGEDV